MFFNYLKEDYIKENFAKKIQMAKKQDKVVIKC